MKITSEEIIGFEVVSIDRKYTKNFDTIEEVIDFISGFKYSEIRKISRLIIDEAE